MNVPLCSELGQGSVPACEESGVRAWVCRRALRLGPACHLLGAGQTCRTLCLTSTLYYKNVGVHNSRAPLAVGDCRCRKCSSGVQHGECLP